MVGQSGHSRPLLCRGNGESRGVGGVSPLTCKSFLENNSPLIFFLFPIFFTPRNSTYLIKTGVYSTRSCRVKRSKSRTDSLVQDFGQEPSKGKRRGNTTGRGGRVSSSSTPPVRTRSRSKLVGERKFPKRKTYRFRPKGHEKKKKIWY